MDGPPCPGDVLLVGRAASVQFIRPIRFQVIRVISEWVTYDGWTWLHGYSLDQRGKAVAKRELFVQPAGLELIADRTRHPDDSPTSVRPATHAGRRRRPDRDPQPTGRWR
ncbi:hypothetical protein JNW88_25060 [Micromonospora sp. ATA32]|nr:hypothetical protein [Micromonospora sp. ATA32]